MDDLFEKTAELLKSLLSIKTGASKDLMVPTLKAPSMKVPKPSIKQPTVGKIPSGLPPPSKKDPVKVAEQLKHPNPGKVNVEVLKVEKNGQWSLDKADDEQRRARMNTPRWETRGRFVDSSNKDLRRIDDKLRRKAVSLPSHVPGKEIHSGSTRLGEEKGPADARNDDWERPETKK